MLPELIESRAAWICFFEKYGAKIVRAVTAYQVPNVKSTQKKFINYMAIFETPMFVIRAVCIAF